MPSTTRNLVLIAITQLGVIVLTVLGSAAALQLAVALDSLWLDELTLSMAALGSFGVFVPVIWIAGALLVLRRAERGWVRAVTFWSGPVLLLALTVLGWRAAARPILSAFFPEHSLGSAD